MLPDDGQYTSVHTEDQHEVSGHSGNRSDVLVRVDDRPETLLETNPSQRPTQGTVPP